MSKNTKVQDEKHPFIIIPPVGAEHFVNDTTDVFGSIALRRDDAKYSVTAEDKWLDVNQWYGKLFESPIAVVMRQWDTNEKIIYAPHNGRLYVCHDLLEVFHILIRLIANEDAKIVK